jgi:hypothetical protein
MLMRLAALLVTAAIQAPQDAATIRGRVAGRGGEPVPNVRVVLKDVVGSVMLPDVRTDADGRFQFVGAIQRGRQVCAVPSVNPALARSEGRFEGEQPLETCSPPGVALGSEIQIALRYGLVYSVTGSIVDSAGAPLETHWFDLVRRDGGGVPTIDMRRRGSQFVVRGVPPGDYRLTSRRVATDGTVLEMGAALVQVADADVENVVLRTTPPVSIVGRVEFAEGRPDQIPKVNVNTLGERQRPPGPSAYVSHVSEALTFQLHGLFGPQMLQVFGAMKPWVVQTIRYRGEEIYGRRVEFRSGTDPNDLVVVLTNKSASVAARVREGSGPRTPRVMIVLITLDPLKAPMVDNVISRPFEPEGPLGLPLVRAGDYLIAAVAPEDMYGPLAKVVPRVARVATRITLAPGEHRVIDLDIVRPD